MFHVRAKWTEEETELFIRTYPVKTAKQMQELFPQYTWQQMLTKATVSGIKKGKEVATESRRQNLNQDDYWKDEEKKIVLEVYPIKGFDGVHEALNGTRTKKSIQNVVRRLGIKRNKKHLTWEQVDLQFERNPNEVITITYKGW